MGNNAKQSFNLRAFTSVLTGISFVLMAVTGLVLFFAPSCRIARDTSWAAWGHNKDQWVAFHVWLSLACLVASIVHIYLNWPALTSYFRSRIHRGWALRTEWIAALGICVIFYVGSVRGVVPFSSLMVWKETYKHGAVSSGPGRHRGSVASQPVQDQGVYLQQNQATGPFESSGRQGAHEQAAGPGGRGPSRGGGGTGRKTLRQFCSDEGIQLPWAISHLRNQGLAARDTTTMREIADAVGIHPREVRGVFQAR